MDIRPLFPIPLGIVDLDRNLTKAEMDFCKKQDTRSNLGNLTSLDNYILDNKQLQKLKKSFEEKVFDFFRNIYQPNDKVGIRITQSWINYSSTGQYHHKHAHPNSFISGVFYVDTNENDKIFFFNEKYSYLKIDPQEYHEYNSESWWMEAKKGRLYLFPSSLVHCVEEIKDPNHTRVSLSFNTFLTGNIGGNSYLTELILKDN